jgi:hypothetical protein
LIFQCLPDAVTLEGVIRISDTSVYNTPAPPVRPQLKQHDRSGIHFFDRH